MSYPAPDAGSAYAYPMSGTTSPYVDINSSSTYPQQNQLTQAGVSQRGGSASFTHYGIRPAALDQPPAHSADRAGVVENDMVPSDANADKLWYKPPLSTAGAQSLGGSKYVQAVCAKDGKPFPINGFNDGIYCTRHFNDINKQRAHHNETGGTGSPNAQPPHQLLQSNQIVAAGTSSYGTPVDLHNYQTPRFTTAAAARAYSIQPDAIDCDRVVIEQAKDDWPQVKANYLTYCRMLQHALCAVPAQAPAEFTDAQKKYHDSQTKTAFKKVRLSLSSDLQVKTAQAHLQVLVEDAINLHEFGVPKISAVNEANEDDGDRKKGKNYRGFVPNYDLKCSTRVKRVIEVVRENALIKLDVIQGINPKKLVGNPDEYLKAKYANEKTNHRKQMNNALAKAKKGGKKNGRVEEVEIEDENFPDSGEEAPPAIVRPSTKMDITFLPPKVGINLAAGSQRYPSPRSASPGHTAEGAATEDRHTDRSTPGAPGKALGKHGREGVATGTESIPAFKRLKSDSRASEVVDYNCSQSRVTPARAQAPTSNPPNVSQDDHRPSPRTEPTTITPGIDQAHPYSNDLDTQLQEAADGLLGNIDYTDFDFLNEDLGELPAWVTSQDGLNQDLDQATGGSPSTFDGAATGHDEYDEKVEGVNDTLLDFLDFLNFECETHR